MANLRAHISALYVTEEGAGGTLGPRLITTST